jgi:hypothetical protein
MRGRLPYFFHMRWLATGRLAPRALVGGNRFEVTGFGRYRWYDESGNKDEPAEMKLMGERAGRRPLFIVLRPRFQTPEIAGYNSTPGFRFSGALA